MSEEAYQLASVKTDLKLKIDNLQQHHYPIIQQISALLISIEFYSEDKLQAQFNSLLCKSELSKTDENFIQKNFISNWDKLKKEKIITNAFINFFERYQDEATKRLIEREGIDARTGYFFEDKFGDLLTLFIKSKKDLYARNGRPKFEIFLQKSLSVKEFHNQQKPDVLIRDSRKNKNKIIIELKRSFSHSSLKWTMKKQLSKWEDFDGAKFLFIILSCSSSKYKIYKALENCRVVCCDLRINADLLNKKGKSEIHDPIEEIFEEIYSYLKEVD